MSRSSGIGEGFSYLPRGGTYQREAGKTFKEVYPTLPPELQAVINNVPPFRMSVQLLNAVIMWCLDATKPQRRAEYARRLALLGYDTDPEVLLKLTRVPKKQRVQVCLLSSMPTKDGRQPRDLGIGGFSTS